MSDKHLIPRLLSGRDQLSIVEKEQILDTVLGGVARESGAAEPAGATAPRRARWWWLGLPALAMTIAVVIIAPWRSTSTTTTSEFSARGGDQLFAAFAPVQSNGKLLFDVHGTSGYRYFAAFSRRTDGTILWYFPTPTGTSLDLATQPATGVLDQGIVLGDEHQPGTYRVYGVFSHEPLTRDAIKAQFDDTALSAGPNTKVIATELVVR